MRLGKTVVRVLCVALIPALVSAKEDLEGRTVDSGSFGVFMNGHRVATETFTILENNKGSLVNSEFKSEKGLTKAVQSSQLELAPNGDLRKYEWKEVQPERVAATVTPSDQFLTEQVISGESGKPLEQPFLLPASTSILDDYFFIHREVLLWRYLAIGCRQEKGQVQCPLHQRTRFGTLDPHSRSSAAATMEFSGREKVMVHDVQRELGRFDLKSDAGDWSFWVDDQYKLVRIVIADQNTEVVRD